MLSVLIGGVAVGDTVDKNLCSSSKGIDDEGIHRIVGSATQLGSFPPSFFLYSSANVFLFYDVNFFYGLTSALIER